MKIISKRISRNEFVSRKNGVIPSLVDEWSVPQSYFGCNTYKSSNSGYTFSSYQTAVKTANELGISSSLIDYSGKFVYQDHNYGLIVSDIIIPNNIANNVTDYTDIYVNIPDGNGGYYDLNDKNSLYHYEGRKIVKNGVEVKILTYSTLNKWYSFLQKYNNTYKPHKSETTNLSDAAEYYYINEYEPKNEVNKKRFCDIDKLYNSRGGDKMYNWIQEYCMPHDANKTPKDDVDYATNSASYVIPIMLSNSIDDLGEMTIFSTKWKDGVDYHNVFCEEKDCNDNDFGTVVDRPYYNDENGNFVMIYDTFIIKGGEDRKGYINNAFYENEFNSDDWSNYTDWRIYNNPENFASHVNNGDCVDTYAISPIDGSILYNPDKCAATEVINYTDGDFIIYDNSHISVINGSYVIPNFTDGCYADVSLKRSKKLPVNKDGALEYATINGKNFYAIKDSNGDRRIYFTKSNNCYDGGSLVIDSRYVIYNGELFATNGNAVSFDDIDGNHIVSSILNGFFTYNGTTFYIMNGEIVVPRLYKAFENEEEVGNYSLSITYVPITDDDKFALGWESVTVNADNTVSICYKLDIKRADYITGYTDSKLELLRRRKINVDELGNELPGYLDLEVSAEDDGYDISVESTKYPQECKDGITVQFAVSKKVKVSGSNYNTPYDQCTLDLLYKVGEVSELEYQKTIDGVKIYNGNYLESIMFYHLGKNNEKIDISYVIGSDSRPYLKKYEEDGEFYRPDRPLYCDITYYIGATLIFDEEKCRYVLTSNMHKGIKYVDTLTVSKSVGTFYMSDNSSFTYNYYKLLGNISAESLDDFNDVYLTNMSYFEMRIMTFCKKSQEFNEEYWEKNNGLIDTPVFRTEYDLLASTPQSEKSNIYIDRGINAAFERHFKLGEVHTIDALENYGNNYFKIK